MEFKIVVDVGLVGFLLVGKFLLVLVILVVKLKIVDYLFIILVFNFGVVLVGEYVFIVVDVLGLILGVFWGCGLGLDFLWYIECCVVLVYVVDCVIVELGCDFILDIDVLEMEFVCYMFML